MGSSKKSATLDAKSVAYSLGDPELKPNAAWNGAKAPGPADLLSDPLAVVVLFQDTVAILGVSNRVPHSVHNLLCS